MQTITPPNEFQQQALAEKAARDERRQSRGYDRKAAPFIKSGMQYLATLRKRAQQKEFDFDLTLEWLAEKLATTHCEATGIRFEGSATDPFGLTIDRKDSALGYTLANCWATCWIYNRCKLDGTHEDVMRLARALVQPTTDQ